MDGWTFGLGDGAEGLTSGVATKWVDLSTQNRAMQEELYPKAVLRRPCGSFFYKNHGRRTGLDLEQCQAIY